MIIPDLLFIIPKLWILWDDHPTIGTGFVFYYLLPVRRITPRNRSGSVRSPVLDRSWAGLDLPVLISSWGIGLATVDRSELQGSIPYFRGEIAGSVRWGRSVQWSRSVQCDQPVLQERDKAGQIGLTVWIDLTGEIGRV